LNVKLFITLGPGRPEDRGKYAQKFENQPKKLPNPKSQNTCFKILFESPKHLHQTTLKWQNILKTCFEIANLGENVKENAQAKCSQNVVISLGYLSFQKITMNIQM